MNYSLTFVSVAVAQKFNEELPGRRSAAGGGKTTGG